MSSPAFDQVIAQAQEALRVSQPTLVISQLTALLRRQLPLPQQAHAHALLAQAYEFQSRWEEAAQLLHPYEDRAHTAALPAAVHALTHNECYLAG